MSTMLTSRSICMISSMLVLVVLAILDQVGDYQFLRSHVTSGCNFLANQFKVKAAPLPIMRSSPGTKNYHPLCPGRIPRRFPHFAYPSVQPFNWKDHMDVTNNTFTTFELVNPKKTYYVCDELELRIYARNGRNESKQHGGELFRAKIFTKNATYSASSSTDGEIVDNGDGTYNAYFTLKWTGIISISVSLIYSSEATYVLDRIRSENQPRIVYFGAFVSPDQKTVKEGYCNIQLRRHMVEKEYCNFTDQATGSPWFCEKPAGFKCSDWKKHRIDGGKCEKQALLVTNQTQREAFKVSKTVLKGSVKSVKVIRGNRTHPMKIPTEDLPVCKLGYNSKQPEVAGYYEQNNWYPPSCRVHRFRDVPKIKNCFSNRQLYFLGDSTIRQLHEYYLDTLKLSKSFLGEKGSGYTGPVRGEDVKNNITTLFAFHKYPVGKTTWTYDKDLEYIANRIDNISKYGSPVVVVSVWAHFESTPPPFYEKRVRGIVAAMGRLLDRNERAVALFKGGNTRQHKTLGQHACCSDWYARDSEERMRKIIFRDKRIGFIDAWDMTHAQLEADNAHPTGSHVANMNDQLLTFLGCS